MLGITTVNTAYTDDSGATHQPSLLNTCWLAAIGKDGRAWQNKPAGRQINLTICSAAILVAISTLSENNAH